MKNHTPLERYAMSVTLMASRGALTYMKPNFRERLTVLQGQGRFLLVAVMRQDLERPRLFLVVEDVRALSNAGV
jgi:hypothetical protein